MKKKILFISILFMCFFINIQGVSAKETKKSTGTTKCTWELPYTGITNEGTLDINGTSSKAEMYTVEYSSNGFDKWGNQFSVISWHKSLNEKFRENSVHKEIKKDGKCPKFIALVINKWDFNLKTSSSGDIFKSYIIQMKGFKYSPTLAIKPSNYLADYPTVFQFDKANVSKTWWGDTWTYVIVLELTYQNGKSKDSNISDMQNKILKKWKNYVDTDTTALAQRCGGDGTDFVNKDNYSDISDLTTYANSAYGADTPAAKDAAISQECWETRQRSLQRRALARSYLKSIDDEGNSIYVANSDSNLLSIFKSYAYLPIKGGEQTKSEIDAQNKSLENDRAATKLKEDLEKNPCISLCQTSLTTSSTPVNECKKGTGYKNCKKALDDCKSKYHKGADDPVNAEINTCIKDAIGDDQFDLLQENYSKLMNSVTLNPLAKAQVPKLNVKYTKNYKVECSDISYLHNFWVAIEIISPILVIVFGSLDFAKSVIAGDEKKIKDSRVNFIKRLAAAILLLLTFAIVSVLVNLTNNDDVKDTSLIKCIVDGK